MVGRKISCVRRRWRTISSAKVMRDGRAGGLWVKYGMHWKTAMRFKLGNLRQPGGFSLLELLIALTILAIALVPVSYFYTKSLQNAEQAGIRTRALMLARERMSEIRALPYDMLRANVMPTDNQRVLYGANGLNMFVDGDDVYGYDFAAGGGLHPAGLWAAMFRYPLPLIYNPYDPYSMGYNNSPNANHFSPNSPTGDPQVNFYASSDTFNDYEYEPIGFYYQVAQRNASMVSADEEDIRMADQRTITGIEPQLVAPGAFHGDFFRTGFEQQADAYSIYGRRTIIMDSYPPDLFSRGGAVRDSDGDQYPPDSDFDGGATAVNPYPREKGPDCKFQQVDRNGRGKMITVQVFWLPRSAPEAYINWSDLNKIELKMFIAPNGQVTGLQGASGGTIDPSDRLGFDPSVLDITP
jgi:prepilin-type N-terminal cleavage/methylation domain-containing protein